MSGRDIAEHLPVIKEFVQVVQDRDAAAITACLQLTPPGTMAEIAAQWIHELLNVVDHQDARIATLAGADMPAAEVTIAYRKSQQLRYAAETRVGKLEAEVVQLRDKLEQLSKLKKDAECSQAA